MLSKKGFLQIIIVNIINRFIMVNSKQNYRRVIYKSGKHVLEHLANSVLA